MIGCIYIPFVDRERKHSKNGVDVVEHDVIQITDDQAPNGRHLRVQHTYGTGDVSSFLIQQGEEERLMKIQQHDGVVVDAPGFRQGFAKRLREEDV